MTYTAHLPIKELPGGSPSGIKKNHNINTVVYSDGTISVWGDKEDMGKYFEEYSLDTSLIIENFLYPRFKWSYGNRFHTISDSLYNKDLISVESYDEVSGILDNLNNGTLEYDNVAEPGDLIPVRVAVGKYGWVTIPLELYEEYEKDEHNPEFTEEMMREKYNGFMYDSNINSAQLYIKAE